MQNLDQPLPRKKILVRYSANLEENSYDVDYYFQTSSFSTGMIYTYQGSPTSSNQGTILASSEFIFTKNAVYTKNSIIGGENPCPLVTLQGDLGEEKDEFRQASLRAVVKTKENTYTTKILVTHKTMAGFDSEPKFAKNFPTITVRENSTDLIKISSAGTFVDGNAYEFGFELGGQPS